MTQKFVKGRTNNHLSWVMVDSTDFATPESALSAATKIKIYGKVRGATGVNFVSSGTGSLTNDIQHVGASALGIYTIALAKADLSDASAAWYDQYIISLSATGAAYQTLIVDGGIDESYVSNTLSYLSNVVSYMSAIESDLNSRITKAVATNSQLSDLHSDLRSYLVLMSDAISNIHSEVTSQFAVNSNYLSYLSAVLSDFQSDFQSRVPKRVATDSQLSDLHSDLRSYLVDMSNVLSDTNSKVAAGTSTSAIAAKVWSDFESKIGSTTSDVFSTLTAGAAGATTSAIAAKVWSDYGSKVGSTPSQVYSYTSNLLSYLSAVLSDLDSNFQSRVPKAVATNSQLSDLHSDLRSYMGGMSDILSNTYSGVTVLQSRVSSTATTASDLVSKIRSDLESGMGVTFSQLYSVVNAASPTASNIAARVWSDYGSKVGSTPSQVYSYTSNLLSYLSAVLSDFESNFSSRVPKAVATNSQLSDLHSDLRSYMVGMSDQISNIHSEVTSQFAVNSNYLSYISAVLSDLQSDFQSRVPKAVATNSQLSDLHSDLLSYLVGMSGAISDAHSAAVVAQSIGASDFSDIRSAINALTVTVTASDISDIASAVAAGVGFTPAEIASKVASHFDTVLPGVNIKQVNDVAVDGTGTTADPWGPV
jgi:hypothetical protein